MRFLRALPALLLIGAAPAERFVIDPATSEVSARVAFLGLASKTARFPKVSGAIALHRDRLEDIDLTVTIDATALTAPDSVTLERLRGPKFFDVARYPAISFTGRRMEKSGDRTARIAGRLSARGITRPAVLSVRFTEPPDRFEGRGALVLEGEAVIDRRDFGMTAYPLIVGRKVRIGIRARFLPI